jgi:hypothetical protein
MYTEINDLSFIDHVEAAHIDPDKSFYPLRETAKILGKSVRTIGDWAGGRKKSPIGFYRDPHSGQWMASKIDLVKFLNAFHQSRPATVNFTISTHKSTSNLQVLTLERKKKMQQNPKVTQLFENN